HGIPLGRVTGSPPAPPRPRDGPRRTAAAARTDKAPGAIRSRHPSRRRQREDPGRQPPCALHLRSDTTWPASDSIERSASGRTSSSHSNPNVSSIATSKPTSALEDIPAWRSDSLSDTTLTKRSVPYRSTSSTRMRCRTSSTSSGTRLHILDELEDDRLEAFGVVNEGLVASLWHDLVAAVRELLGQFPGACGAQQHVVVA